MQERQGAIPRQFIADMANAGYIKNIDPVCLQPSSIDLRLSDECYRIPASYLPRKGESIRQLVEHGSLFRHPLSQPLEKNATYLIRLQESLALPPGIHATASNKSSSGRINLRTRLLADGVQRFDSVPAGFQGTLWVEVAPKSFPILVHPGDRLNQMRFFSGDAHLSSLEHRLLSDKFHILREANGHPIAAADDSAGGITMTVELSTDIVGWRAHPTSFNVLDTANFDHDPHDFFEPVIKPKRGELILQDGSFYILVTKERILVPPNYAAEMAAYDPTKGEFRSHYAGFFDPGFGWKDNTDQDQGRQAVLEICTLGHDLMLRDGQPICLMVYENLTERPDVLYGTEIQSNYSNQHGPRLAKWFKLD